MFLCENVIFGENVNHENSMNHSHSTVPLHFDFDQLRFVLLKARQVGHLCDVLNHPPQHSLNSFEDHLSHHYSDQQVFLCKDLIFGENVNHQNSMNYSH
jgi:hypothetical protein